MYSVRLKHTAVENLISEVTFINHDSLTKSNSEVPISGKQLGLALMHRWPTNQQVLLSGYATHK